MGRRLTMRMAQVAACLAISLVAVSGCSWQTTPSAPDYRSSTAPIPLRITLREMPQRTSLIPAISVYNAKYLPVLADRLNAWRVFESCGYSYMTFGTPDAELQIDIRGTWTDRKFGILPCAEDWPSIMSDFGSTVDFAAWFMAEYFTLGCWGVLPARVNGNHALQARLMKRGRLVAEYNIEARTTAWYGRWYGYLTSSAEMDQLQCCRLAYNLAGAIEKDWPRISQQVAAK